MLRKLPTLALFSLSVICALSACGDDDDDGGENTGSACGSPDECYPEVQDKATIKGQVICLDRVPGGYCTHHCTTDADCCAAEGECRTGIPQVCAPFESTGEMFCFLSCETDVIGGTEENEYCHQYAHEAFGCRSTGGGALNRKVCVP